MAQYPCFYYKKGIYFPFFSRAHQMLPTWAASWTRDRKRIHCMTQFSLRKDSSVNHVIVTLVSEASKSLDKEIPVAWGCNLTFVKLSTVFQY